MRLIGSSSRRFGRFGDLKTRRAAEPNERGGHVSCKRKLGLIGSECSKLGEFRPWAARAANTVIRGQPFARGTETGNVIACARQTIRRVPRDMSRANCDRVASRDSEKNIAISENRLTCKR